MSVAARFADRVTARGDLRGPRRGGKYPRVADRSTLCANGLLHNTTMGTAFRVGVLASSFAGSLMYARCRAHVRLSSSVGAGQRQAQRKPPVSASSNVRLGSDFCLRAQKGGCRIWVVSCLTHDGNRASATSVQRKSVGSSVARTLLRVMFLVRDRESGKKLSSPSPKAVLRMSVYGLPLSCKHSVLRRVGSTAQVYPASETCIGLSIRAMMGYSRASSQSFLRAFRTWTFAGSAGAGSTCSPSFGVLGNRG